jgi:cytochrome c553
MLTFTPSRACLLAGALILASTAASPARADEFAESIRPVLAQNCSPCHNPKNPKNRVNFLKANTVQDIELDRGLWRDVATQLRNRTMPPVETKLTEEDRLRVSNWIETRLRQTACYIGDYAGAVALRRLNRREYHNTIRDLLGVDFNVSGLFPDDGTGGAGFDTNGETLYVPPLMMERYLEAAEQILDRAIITPDLLKTYPAAQMMPVLPAATASRDLAPGSELSVLASIYIDGDYDVRVAVGTADMKGKLALKVDGGAPVPLVAQVPRGFGGGGGRGPRLPTYNVRVRFARGLRMLSVVSEPVSGAAPVPVTSFTIQQKPTELAPDRLALHYRIMGTEPGNEPLQPRKAAQQILRTFLTRAYRRPAEMADVTPLLTLYDRAAERGDPFEERIKLALKAVLVSPDFLFKMEHRNEKPGIYPVGQYELANRLSYFLWSTMPDEELTGLAAQGKLQDPKVLTEQVDRMLDDPKSHTFTSTYAGVGRPRGAHDHGVAGFLHAPGCGRSAGRTRSAV